MLFLKWIAVWVDRLCVLIGAFVGSQIPAFMQQYSQRLAGHIAELNYTLLQIKNMAQFSNKSVDGYVQKFLMSSDADFVMHGKFMQSLQLRWETFSHAYNSLTQSSVWLKAYVFINELQSDIAYATLSTFQPSMIFNLESLAYALFGIVLALTIYKTLLKIFQIMFRKFFRKPILQKN